MKKTTVLRKAILERRAVAVVGCHDAMSAKVIEACGFEAIQISCDWPRRERCCTELEV